VVEGGKKGRGTKETRVRVNHHSEALRIPKGTFSSETRLGQGGTARIAGYPDHYRSGLDQKNRDMCGEVKKGLKKNSIVADKDTMSYIEGKELRLW